MEAVQLMATPPKGSSVSLRHFGNTSQAEGLLTLAGAMAESLLSSRFPILSCSTVFWKISALKSPSFWGSWGPWLNFLSATLLGFVIWAETPISTVLANVAKTTMKLKRKLEAKCLFLEHNKNKSCFWPPPTPPPPLLLLLLLVLSTYIYLLTTNYSCQWQPWLPALLPYLPKSRSSHAQRHW